MSSVFYSWRQVVLQSDLEANTKHVLVTLGCHMNEMGESCFPSISTLCLETSLSKPTVIKHLAIAESAGFIAIKKHGFAGQKWKRNEYCAVFPECQINQKLAELSAENSADFEGDLEPENSESDTQKVVKQFNHVDEKVVKPLNEGGKNDTQKVVKPLNPSSSINSQLNNTARARGISDDQKTSPPREGLLASRLIKLGVGVTSQHPTLLRWVADGVPDGLIDECVALARQQKPLPERIAANYLDAIIRDQGRPKADMRWLNDDEATIAKGRELGVDAKVGESMPDYRKRLKAMVQQQAQGDVCAG